MTAETSCTVVVKLLVVPGNVKTLVDKLTTVDGVTFALETALGVSMRVTDTVVSAFDCDPADSVMVW